MGVRGLLVVAALVVMALASVACSTTTSSNLPSSATVAQPALDPRSVSPPVFSNWIRPDTGQFEAYTWDDRPISEEAKAQQPWYDGRWQPFGHCMSAAGFETRPNPNQPFGQADLDRLIDKLNALNPDGAANKARLASEGFDGISGAFLQCADRWLTIRPDEWEKRGARPLEPGEIPGP